MNNSIKSSDRVYLKKPLVILKLSLIMLLFIIVSMIAYLSFFGSKHFIFIDNIIKHNIEKNLDQINISKIRTGIALSLKDASIVLSLEDLELSYKKSAVFIAPDLRLKFDIIGLILRRPKQMFKGIILDEKKVAIVYDNLSSPPTYGDYFFVVMFGRYFISQDIMVSFIIVDDGKRSDWSDLSDDEAKT